MPKTTVQGAIFIKAHKDSTFGRVFKNNMDQNSFGNDMEKSTIEKQLALMITNGKTAIFHIHDIISEMDKYKNCEVSKWVRVMDQWQEYVIIF